MQRLKSQENKHVIMIQKNSYPHLVDKVVNK